MFVTANDGGKFAVNNYKLLIGDIKVDQSIRCTPEPCHIALFGAIGAAYSVIGGLIDKPTRIMYLQNLTDATLWFSFDGVEDHLPLPANGFFLLDVTTNRTSDRGFFLENRERIWVKQFGIPTLGGVYLTTFHGTN